MGYGPAVKQQMMQQPMPQPNFQPYQGMPGAMQQPYPMPRPMPNAYNPYQQMDPATMQRMRESAQNAAGGAWADGNALMSRLRPEMRGPRQQGAMPGMPPMGGAPMRQYTPRQQNRMDYLQSVGRDPRSQGGANFGMKRAMKRPAVAAGLLSAPPPTDY